MSKLKRTILVLLLACLLCVPASGGAYAGWIIKDGNLVMQPEGTDTGTDPVTWALDETSDSPLQDETECTDAAFASSSGCSHTLNESTGRCSSCGGVIVAYGKYNDGGAYYTSLQEALNAGGTVYLLRDVIPTVDSTLTIRKGVTVVLDLNGKRLGDEECGVLADIVNYGTFTLTDSQNNSGKLYGNIYTRGYEVREPNGDASGYVVTDCAYGAVTQITGGKIYGDVVVSHEYDHTYQSSAEKPNPSATVSGGTFIGGGVYVLDENQGTAQIIGGRFSTEPLEKYISKGYEAEKDDENFYCITAKTYLAGWIEPTFTSGSGMTEYAENFVRSNRTATGFVAGDMDLVDVSAIMRTGSYSFDPETDTLKCALTVSCSDAVVHGSGDNEKVTGMSFTFSPVLYIYHGGEPTVVPLTWDQISDDSMTIRLPVDPGLACGTVDMFLSDDSHYDAICTLTVETDSYGNKYVQVCLGSTYLAKGVRTEAVIPDTCTVIYNSNGGSFDADGTVLTSVISSVAGKGDLTLRDNSFTREHYTFSGWKETSGNCYQEGAVISFVTGDMIFSAIWTPEQYNITYVLNGGENSTFNTDTYDYDSTFTLEDPVMENAVFAGWYDNEGFEGEPVTGIKPGETGDRTFYAKWNVEVAVILSGTGSGTVADNNGEYQSGDTVVIPFGGAFNINIFHTDGSYISALKINGEEKPAAASVTLEDLRQNTEIEIIFSETGSGSTQLTDLSEAKNQNGEELDSEFRTRAEDAFAEETVAGFKDGGIEEALDRDVLNTAFAEATGNTIEENDSLAFRIEMKISTVFTNENRINGYTFDAEPFVTVIGSDGTAKGTAAVPNEAISGKLVMRIPVDSLAFMDDAVVYHEGQLQSYIKIDGSSPERYVDIGASSFSEYTVLLLDGTTNHPAAAIGSTGYTTIEEALNHAIAGDTVYVLTADAVIPDRQALLNGEETTLSEALTAFCDGDELVCDGIHVAVGYESDMVTSGDMDLFGAAPVEITYHNNVEGSEITKTFEETVVRDNKDSEINFVNGTAEFKWWNTKADGTGKIYEVGETIENITEESDLYAIWNIKNVAAHYDETNMVWIEHATLASAIEAAPVRGQVKLLCSVREDVTVSKELLLDLNGCSWTKKVSGTVYDFSTGSSVYSHFCSKYNKAEDGGFTVLRQSGTNVYQFRGSYKISYVMGGSTSATMTKPTTNPEGTRTFLTEDMTLYRAYKTRMEKSAYFAGWYLDSGLKKTTDPVTGETRVEFSGEVTETKADTDIKTYLKAVAAPYWPTKTVINEKDGTYKISNTIYLYPKWYWTIYVGFNNYGTVTLNGKDVTNGATYYYQEGSKPVLKFTPNEGYHVYRVTIKNYNTIYPVYKQADMYSYTPSWYEDFKDGKGICERNFQVSQTIAVVFARGTYNPETGDTGMPGLWVALMGLSMITAGAVGLRLKKRKRGADL